LTFLLLASVDEGVLGYQEGHRAWDTFRFAFVFVQFLVVKVPPIKIIMCLLVLKCSLSDSKAVA
jgi:hypothetical protein